VGVLWAITSPRRIAVAIVLALLEGAPELVAELSSAARYTVHRRLPWHAHLIERVTGVPEIVRSLLAYQGLTDEQIAVRWREVQQRHRMSNPTAATTQLDPRAQASPA